MRAATKTRGACPLCGGRELTSLPVPHSVVAGPIGALPGLGLRRCGACAFEFVDPRPDDVELEAFYAAQDYTAHEPIDDAAARRRAREQLDAVVRAGAWVDGGEVLDVGCGGGQLLALARARGAEPIGVDPAAHAHRACAALAIPVVPRLELLDGRRFDGISMSHVLEHVPEVVPTLRELRRRLRATGWLCVEVPNRASLRARLSAPLVTRLGADERHRAFPIHLSYFTPDTLHHALSLAGFDVVTLTSTGFGLQALVPRRSAPRRRPGAAHPAADDGAPPPAAPRSSGLRQLVSRGRAVVKQRYHDALLGENLVAVARPAVAR
ncbi:MAG: class I SAM-dependent methyltransferase [Kofleriaceae bacterium]